MPDGLGQLLPIRMRPDDCVSEHDFGCSSEWRRVHPAPVASGDGQQFEQRDQAGQGDGGPESPIRYGRVWPMPPANVIVPQMFR